MENGKCGKYDSTRKSSNQAFTVNKEKKLTKYEGENRRH